jgi:DNA processing protein
MRNDSNELYYWVALNTVPNVGQIRFVSLVKHFGSPQKVLEASVREISKVEDVGEITASCIKGQVNYKEAERQVKAFEKSGCGWMTFTDSDYPKRLRQISDPPPFLFVKGSLTEADELAVALVGSRQATDYGKTITQRITSELVAKGITIVSGLATGIDSYAHKAALEAGGRTIAVLGCGLDIIYPSENKILAKKIEAQGALVSEFLFGTEPIAENFPKRNRIISGLSLGVIVVEAPAKSGALLTAQYALEQNREVFAVPGNLGKKTSEGANNLIKQGAKLVTRAEDILEELNLSTTMTVKEFKKQLPELAEQEKAIYQVLSVEPIHIDNLAQESNLSISETLTGLLNLELKGLARQRSGKFFVRT